MKYSEMVKQLSTQLEISQTEVKRLLKISTDEIQSILDSDKGLSIPRLGTLFASMKKERKAYNPYHQCMMLLPKKRVVKYHVALHLKERFRNKRIEP